MKKIVSLGAAAAVLSLTAVAASAAIAPEFDTTAPVAGETVTVNIVANGMTQEATTFTVNATNLTLVDSATANIENSMTFFEGNKFTWAGVAAPADGTVLLTLTYTVDAAAGEEVSVSLTPDEGFTDISADAVAVVVVDGASTDVPDVDTVEEPVPTEEPAVTTEEPIEEPVTTEEPGLTVTTDEEPATVEPTTADATTADAAGDAAGADDKGNPTTGVALAVVPAVLAGAAIVVSKKRK